MTGEPSRADLEELGFHPEAEIHDVEDAGVTIAEIMMALATTRYSVPQHVEVRTGDTGIAWPVPFSPYKVEALWGFCEEGHEHEGDPFEVPAWYVRGSQLGEAGNRLWDMHLYLEPASSSSVPPRWIKMQIVGPHLR